MNDLKVGQTLTLYTRFDNQGTISDDVYPHIVIEINDELNIVEVAQIDSLQNKWYQAAFEKNHVLFLDNPVEKVIDKDSYIRLDGIIQFENYDDLVKYRRQKDCLSKDKLKDLLKHYKKYHENHEIFDDKQVFMSKEEIEKLNN